MKLKPMSLTSKIFIGLIGGALFGALLHYVIPAGDIRDGYIIDGALYLAGQGFMRLLQMLVVPLVFFSLSTGALSMGDTQSLGKIGMKTIIFYIFTTACAIALALGIATLLKPGLGMDMSAAQKASVKIAEAPSTMETLLNIIPTNPIKALAEGNMLQIIVFALLVGVICAMMPDKLKSLSRLLNEGNDLMMQMTTIVMRVAPLGVFALIARTFSRLGFETFAPMLTYMLAVLLTLVAHVFLIYIPLLILFTRLNPMTFFRKMMPALTFAFSSASSGATIPISLQCNDDMGVPRQVSSFTIPLGATINMDGTAIMQGCAVIFISLAYGVPLTLGDFGTVILTATLASVGTAAIPGVGLVTLSMVLTSVGLPVEGIAVIMGIDRILDMARTSVNTCGDSVVTLIVAKTEKLLDTARYRDVNGAAETDEF